MSIASATRKLLSSKPRRRADAPPTQAEIDAQMIRDEKQVGEFEAKLADLQRRLEAEPMGSPKHAALHAEKRQLYRDAGYSEDLVFNGGVLRHREE